MSEQWFDLVAKLSPAGILIFLLFWMLFDLLKTRRAKPVAPICPCTDVIYNTADQIGKLTEATNETMRRTEDLHEWHKSGEDGQQHWKNQALTAQLKIMSGAVENLVILGRDDQAKSDALLASGQQNTASIDRLTGAIMVLVERKPEGKKA